MNGRSGVKEINTGESLPRLGIVLSVAFHLIVFASLFFWYHQSMTADIVAAGPGEGGEGGGGSIEVGVADPSTLFGFAKPQTASFVGDEDSSVNNARLETAKPETTTEDALLPPTEKPDPRNDTVKTDRPVVPREERIFTGKEERGKSQSQTAQVGSSYGSPTPVVRGGVGLGSGGGIGGGTGLPGGSAYGRVIQQILSRNYNPPAVESSEVEYVVIILRIGSDGSIRSLSGGRVSPAFIKRRSSIALVNNAAERAIIASDPLPPFPPGTLTGKDEVRAEIWFRYPK
jgi:hypothetical protein